MNDDKTRISETVSGFNTLSVEIRTRIETLTRQVLIISGGIQTITISAFLSGSKPVLDLTTIELLKCGWLQLSASIILCLVFMLSQIFGLIHVGKQYEEKLTNLEPDVKVLWAWYPLRIFNWVVSLSAFVFCISGVYTISKAAISLIGSQSSI